MILKGMQNQDRFIYCFLSFTQIWVETIIYEVPHDYFIFKVVYISVCAIMEGYMHLHHLTNLKSLGESNKLEIFV